MASFRIPEAHLGGLAQLISMPEEVARELVSSLEKAPASFDPQKLLKTVTISVTGLPEEDAESINSALMSLFLLRARSDESLNEVVDELNNAINESDAEVLKFPDEIQANIKRRLSMFLSIESLLVSSKAISVVLESDNLFSKARVITDIRPVFGESAKELPKAAVIIHQLGIHYFKNGDHKEFFVNLDSEEIQALVDTLERAKEKAERLKAILASANLPLLDVEK